MPTWLDMKSSAFEEEVRWSLISFATKNVKRNGLQSPTSSTLAKPPTRAHLPAWILNVIGSTRLLIEEVRIACSHKKRFILRRSHFLGTTILSSSGVSRSVKQPGTRRPGVSYRTFPPDRSTLMNLRVVPGSGDVVTLPFHLLAFPARILPFFLDEPPSSTR